MYLKQGRMFNVLTKFRIGDLPFQQVKQKKGCASCGSSTVNMVEHIFLSCNQVSKEIKDAGFNRTPAKTKKIT